MATAGERSREPARAEGLGDEWRNLRRYVGRKDGRQLVSEGSDAFRENRLLVYASAISFRILSALIPLALAGVALLGYLDLEEVWTDELAPRLRDRTSDAAFQVVDSTVNTILTSQRGFWLTAGAALAIWQVSGAIRTTIRALNDIYGAEERRSFLRRYGVSLALAVVAALSLGVAVGAVQFGPFLAARVSGGLAFDVLAFAARWGIAVVLLLLVVGLIIRAAAIGNSPMRWLGGAALGIVVTWIAVSLLFAVWVAYFASYGDVYGGLAVAIVLMTYINLSAIVFLVGVQLDALVRKHARPE